METAVLVLFFVLILLMIRRIGNINIPMWLSMTLGAVLVLLLGQITPVQAYQAVQRDVIFFLLGMFIVGAAVELSGILKQYAFSHLIRIQSPKKFLFVFIFAAGFLSAFLMNDTIAIILAPFALWCAKHYGLPAKTMLYTLAASVTTGSVMSPIGAPPNLLIALTGLNGSFLPFLIYLLIPALISLCLVYFLISAFLRLEKPAASTFLGTPGMRGASVCAGAPGSPAAAAADSAAAATDSAAAAADRAAADSAAAGSPASGGAASVSAAPPSVAGPAFKIETIKTENVFRSEKKGHSNLLFMTKFSLAIVFLTILIYIGASFSGHSFPIAVIAFAGALPLLLFSDRRLDLIKKMDWLTLLFFISMFVLIESVNMTGFFQNIFPENFESSVPVLYTMSIIVSQFISNVPYVSIVLPMLESSSASIFSYLTLAAGNTIAGNLTIFGAASNVIIIQHAEKSGETLTFFEFLKFGLPLVILQSIVFLVWLTALSYFMPA